MIGSLMAPEPRTVQLVRAGPLASVVLGEPPATEAKRKRLMRERREQRSALDPYVASIDLLLHADDLIPGHERDERGARAPVPRSEPAARARARAAAPAAAPEAPAAQRASWRGPLLPAPLNGGDGTDGIADPLLGETKLHWSVPDHLVIPYTLKDADGSMARFVTMEKSQKTLVRQMIADAEGRRRRYNTRFEFIGDFWQRKLRHCGWRQSLRMAFEVPALHAARYAEMGHMIDKRQFLAACNYAIVRDAKHIAVDEFDGFFNSCFDLFDVEAQGKIDYREFLATLLFFRVPAESDPSQLIEVWYRYYDGDVTRGLTLADFLKLMVTLCVTQDEATRLLRLMDLKSLEVAAGARAKHLGAGGGAEHAAEAQGFRGATTTSGPVVRVVNGSIVVDRGPAPDAPAAGARSASAGGGVSAVRAARKPGAHPSLGSMLDATLRDMTDAERERTAAHLAATRYDARMLRADSRVNTADLASDTHAELMGPFVSDQGGPGPPFLPEDEQASAAPAIADPYSRRNLFDISMQNEIALRASGVDTAADTAVADAHSRTVRADGGVLQAAQTARRAGRATVGFSDARDAIFGFSPAATARAAAVAEASTALEFPGPSISSVAAPDGLEDDADDDSDGNAEHYDGPFRPTHGSLELDGDDMLVYGSERPPSAPAPHVGTSGRGGGPAAEDERPASHQSDARAHSALAKAERLVLLRRTLERAELEADDPEAPWNRGRGTLTEVRVPSAYELKARRLARTGDEQLAAHIRDRPSTREALFHINPKPVTEITLPRVAGMVPSDEEEKKSERDPSATAHAASASMRRTAAPGSYGATLPLGTDNFGVTAIDPIRGHVLQKRREERLRRGRLLEPLVGVRRITLHMIRYLVQMSPGLTDEVHRLRLARLPAIVRSAYLSEQLAKQIKLSQAKYDRLREDVQTKRALSMWRRSMMRRHYDYWKNFARFVIWQRVKVNSVRARRAVRSWYARKQRIRVARAQTALARTHFLRAFSLATFKQWVMFTRFEQRTFRRQWTQACALYRQRLLEVAWARLKARAHFMRASKHFVRKVEARCMSAWRACVVAILAERRAAELQNRVNVERAARAIEVVVKADVAAEEARVFQEQTASLEAFEAEAARIREEERLAAQRLEADRELRRRRLLEAQRVASEAGYVRRKERFQRLFEEEWRARVKASVFGARAAAEAYCASKEGRDAMAADAKKMLMASDVTQLNQEESTWFAEFNLKDGCIHFIRPADPTADPPLELLDLNFDQMRLDDAILVASAHYIAKQGVIARGETLKDKDADWNRAWPDQCSRMFAQRWRAKRARALFLERRRLEVETLVDPYSGALYYEDVWSGALFDAKPRLFRAEPVHPPEPLWHLKVTTVTDPGTGVESPGWVYQHRKIPWKSSPTPPDGYRMCGVCGSDFATRRCVGAGCDGLLYCYACFVHYHPKDNFDWREHWTLCQRRIPVVEVSKAEREAEAEALAAGLNAAEVAAAEEQARREGDMAARVYEKSAAERAVRASQNIKERAERGVAKGTGSVGKGTGSSVGRGTSRGGSSRGSDGGSRPRSKSPDSDHGSSRGAPKSVKSGAGSKGSKGSSSKR